MISQLQRIVSAYYDESGDRGYDWAGRLIDEGSYDRILDVGCGNGERLLSYLRKRPMDFCGIEGNSVLAEQATAKGIRVIQCDLNGQWPIEDNRFQAIHSSQVIEHIHNTRFFLMEALRTLEPGGRLVMTSENLGSFLNLGAMAAGFVPFSLQKVCGWYIGNPLGLHDQGGPPDELSEMSLADPAFSGAAGHVRVLAARQARELLERVGFTRVSVSSVGLMPIPKWLGKPLERIFPGRGHWLLMDAFKPHR